MGVCASQESVDEQQQHRADAPIKQPAADKQQQQQQSQQQQPPVQQVEPKQQPPLIEQQSLASEPVAPNSGRSSTTQHSASGSGMDDDEYRSQIKSIFLFIFDRLVQTMEYCRDDMHQLVLLQTPTLTPERASYLSLFGSARVEEFLRSVFDLSSVSIPAPRSAGGLAPDDSGVLAEQNFILLLKGAQQQVNDGTGGAKLSRADLTTNVKEVCAATQSRLAAAQSTLTQNQAAFPRYNDLAAHFVFFQRTLNFTTGDIANDAQLLERNVEEIIKASSSA